MRQPNQCVMAAISGVNAIAAKYCAELKTADAVPRSAVGNQLATSFALAGTAGDSANPTAKRKMNSVVTAPRPLAITEPQPVAACSSVNSDHAKMLQA